MVEEEEEEGDNLNAAFFVVVSIIGAIFVVLCIFFLRRKYVKMIRDAQAKSQTGIVCSTEVFDRHILSNQDERRSEYWRLYITFWPGSELLSDDSCGPMYFLDCGARCVVHTNAPLPVQKFCCVEFTLCRGSLGGLDGNVSFGLTVRPPKAYCMMGEYPGSYGYSSDGYVKDGTANTMKRISDAMISPGDVISIVVDRISGKVCIFRNGKMKDSLVMKVARFRDRNGWGIYPSVGINNIPVKVCMNAGTREFLGPQFPDGDLRRIYYQDMALGWSIDFAVAEQMRQGRAGLKVEYKSKRLTASLLGEVDETSSEGEWERASLSSLGLSSLSSEEAQNKLKTLSKFKEAVHDVVKSNNFVQSTEPLNILRRKVKHLIQNQTAPLMPPEKVRTTSDIFRCRRKGCKCRCWSRDIETTMDLCACGHARVYHRALPGTRDEEEELTQDTRLDVACGYLETKQERNKWRRGLFEGHRFFYNIETSELTMDPTLVENPTRGIRPQSHHSCHSCTDGARRHSEPELISKEDSIREWRKRRHEAEVRKANRKEKRRLKRLAREEKENMVSERQSTSIEMTTRSFHSEASGTLIAALNSAKGRGRSQNRGLYVLAAKTKKTPNVKSETAVDQRARPESHRSSSSEPHTGSEQTSPMSTSLSATVASATFSHPMSLSRS